MITINNINSITKLIITVISSLILVACGGSDTRSGDSNSEASSNNNPGGGSDSSGSCATIFHPKVGLKTVELSVGKGGSLQPLSEIYAESTVTVSSNILFSVRVNLKKSLAGKVLNKSKVTQFFTIADDYKKMTKQVQKTQTFSRNSSVHTLTTEYLPFIKSPYGKVCEGQTWTSDSNVKETNTSQQFPQNSLSKHISVIGSIIAVNIKKDVTAGSFNTVQIKVEDGDKVITSWVDIKQGLTVATEIIQGNGIKINTELVSFSN